MKYKFDCVFNFLEKVFPLSLRGFHTSIVVHGEVNKQLLSKLRKTTGFPFIKCSQALEKFDNNITEVCSLSNHFTSELVVSVC